jgi:hypothetical protein
MVPRLREILDTVDSPMFWSDDLDWLIRWWRDEHRGHPNYSEALGLMRESKRRRMS